MSKRDDAETIFTQIETVAQMIEAAKTVAYPTRAAALRDLAVAFRLADGGPQPGGAFVDK